MTPKPPRTMTCTRAEARTRRQQARAFVDVADLVLTEQATGAEGHVSAALAVLAAIAAADSICGMQLGRWSRGQDHGQAAALLEQVDLDDDALPKKFRRVLLSKDLAHYSPKLMTSRDALTLVRLARSLVEAAERL